MNRKLLLGFVSSLLSGCLGFSGDPSGAGEDGDGQTRTPGGIAYTLLCEATECEAQCKAAAAEDCAKCESACWEVMTSTSDTSCVLTCAKVCSPTCSYCPSDSPCQEVGYWFEIPWKPDPEVVAACKGASDACLPDKGWCSAYSRLTEREAALQFFACLQDPCDDEKRLACLPPGGDLGALAQATGCFGELNVTSRNGFGELLRPEVKKTLAWCYSLGSCEEVAECENDVWRSAE